MRVRFWLLLFITSLASTAATAQLRTNSSLLAVPEAQAEIALRGDDYFLVGLRTPLRTNEPDAQLDRLGLNLGYEHFWNNRWSGGATLFTAAYTTYPNGSDVAHLNVAVTPELFVRHWNTLAGFNFRQRLGVEYFTPGGSGLGSRALTSLRFDLDRVFSVGRLALRPRLAYEGRTFLRFQRPEEEPKERVIDYTTLRAEVGIRLSDHFDFTPWFARQTTYNFVLQQTDSKGNVVVPGGRRNFVTPVAGLDLRYTIFSGKPDPERRQLPTQH